MRQDKQFLILTHLSQLIPFLIGFGSLLLPLFLWISKKDTIAGLDMHGKAILNFQISLIVYTVICVPLILLFGIGLVGFLIIGILAVVSPILNAIKVNKGEMPSYPFSFHFIS